MNLKVIFTSLAMLVLASPIFAQSQQGGQQGGGSNYAVPAAYIAIGLAAGLCGLGQAKAVASSAEAMARNPGATAAIRLALILGLAFIESLTLFTLVASYIVNKG